MKVDPKFLSMYIKKDPSLLSRDKIGSGEMFITLMRVPFVCLVYLDRVPVEETLLCANVGPVVARHTVWSHEKCG